MQHGRLGPHRIDTWLRKYGFRGVGEELWDSKVRVGGLELTGVKKREFRGQEKGRVRSRE